MKQTKDEIEAGYEKPDPWSYQNCPADIDRKARIIEMCKVVRPSFECALDVGCGEGWITKDLPAKMIYGFELSEHARLRFPQNVLDLDIWHRPANTCDLVVCTGALYTHYEFGVMADLIRLYACDTIITSHIKAWELPNLEKLLDAKCTITVEFPYSRPEADYTQVLRVFRK